MAQNKRLFLSLSEEDVSKLDFLRSELGMNRSEYIRYVIAGQRKILNPSIRYKEMIERLSSIDLSMRTIALKEEVSAGDTLAIYSELKELKALLGQATTFGQVDQKLTEGGADGRKGI